MRIILAWLMLSATVALGADGPMDYKTAYQKAQEGDKPLLVLVTATWCPPCQSMKLTTIPELLSKDAFKEFHYATVDFDAESELAKKLIGERGVPQLILFQKVDGEWNRRYLAGYQTVARVESFILEPDILRTADAKSAATITSVDK